MAYLKEKTARHSTVPYSAKIRRVTSAFRFVYFSRLQEFMQALPRDSMGNLFYLQDLHCFNTLQSNI